MVKRNIIKIDEDKCNGCGLCIPNCPEGALQIIDNKVRLVSDLFCDGLGACMGHCPQGAIEVEEREAEPYNEYKVMENIVKHGENTITAHLNHLRAHGETKYLTEALDFLKEKNIDVKPEEDKPDLACGCPGTAVREVNCDEDVTDTNNSSALKQWPVQLSLLPPSAPFFDNSHLLVCADCVPFATANFHSKLLNGKSLVIGCPKLDDPDPYVAKLSEIFKNNNIKSITVAMMEVPCCYSLHSIVERALRKAEVDIPLIKETIKLNGNIE